jgi:hypothetical protein
MHPLPLDRCRTTGKAELFFFSAIDKQNLSAMSYTEKSRLNGKTTPLSALPTPTADTPPAIINPSFEPKDNPLSRTIHALLRLFRMQSKPDSDKREKPPVTMHNTYGDNIHGQNITINNGVSKEQMEELKKADREHTKTGEHDIYRKQ